jgi:sulfatase modifying factor 1
MGPMRYAVVACVVLAGLLVSGYTDAQTAPERRRLLRGVVRIEVPGREDTGTGIVVAAEGRRVYIVTALHVVVGPPEVRKTSGWQRNPGQIRIDVQFFGDPVAVRGRLFDRWDEANDIGVVVVDDERIAERGTSVVFGLGSPATLSPPYPAAVMGHGGSSDWDWISTRVRSMSRDGVTLDASRITSGHSGGPLIDTTRHLLIGMVTAVASGQAEAVSADVVMGRLESWAIEHHLRRAGVSTPMVRVVGGTFAMGGSEVAGTGEVPRQVFLDTFFIDMHEVSVADFRRFVIDAGHPYTPGIGTCNFNQPGREAFPMNCVTWEDASAFARWAGKTLPTEAQWEKAARGTMGWKYPWGNRSPKKGDAALHVEWPVAVGSHPADRSPYGALDMLGNVSEWVADWYQRSHLAALVARNPRGPASGQDRVLRGSSFGTLLDRADLGARKRDLPDSGRKRFDYGFRCVLEETRTE